MKSNIIYQFKENSIAQDWVVVNDAVMGGQSRGSVNVKDGLGIFAGAVSLENNGGFSSVRHTFPKIDLEAYTKISIKLKGDGNNYQFRIKANSKEQYFYISTFSTSGEWEEIEFTLDEMYPSFRGRKLDKPNFSHSFIEEIAFLIGNKQKGMFELLIEKIELL